MDTSVLGLKIVRIQEGYQDLLEINGDSSWTKKVWDIRRDLPTGTNTDGCKTVLLLSGVESGFILTIAACLEGRKNDCISAWIFVPSNLEISGKQLAEVIDGTSKELMVNERNNEKLQQIFDKRYPVSKASRSSIISSGAQFAYRKYGTGCGYTLQELLANPDQTYYRQYKGVFLIDNSSGISPTGADLSNQKLKELVRIEPIAPVHGFQLSINSRSLTDPIFLPEGDEVIVIWKRNGFRTIKKRWIVHRGETVPVPSEPDYMVIVPFEVFLVKDKKTGKPIQDYSIRINNLYLTEGSSLAVHESSVRNCPACIDAPGYSSSSKVFDLTQNQIVVNLEKEKHTYDFKIELLYEDNRYADLHLETDVKLNGRSPIAGYRRDDKYLYYNSFGKREKLLAVLVLLVTLFLGLVGGILLPDPFNKKSKDIENTTKIEATGKDSEQHPEAKGNRNSNPEIDSVISYLDSHEKWNRTEMEKFEVIKGLWDALNERRFDDILKYKQQLQRSKKFMALVAAIDDNKHKKFQFDFTKDNDITIGTKEKGYIKKLYDAKESSHSTVSSRTGNSGKPDVPTDDQQNNW